MGLCLPLAGVDAGLRSQTLADQDADEALEPVMRPHEDSDTSALDSVSASMNMPATGCWLSQGDKWCHGATWCCHCTGVYDVPFQTKPFLRGGFFASQSLPRKHAALFFTTYKNNRNKKEGSRNGLRSQP